MGVGSVSVEVEKTAGKTAREVFDIDVFRAVFDVRSMARNLALSLAQEHRVSVRAMELVISIVERATVLDYAPLPPSEFIEKARWLIREARELGERYAHLPGITGDMARSLLEKTKRFEELIAEVEGVRVQ